MFVITIGQKHACFHFLTACHTFKFIFSTKKLDKH